jgi:hypothetical protein
MHQVRFLKSACEQLATAPFLQWNLQVPQLAKLVQAVQPLELQQELVLAQVQAAELAQALRPVVELVRLQEPEQLVQAQERPRCHQQPRSQCQPEPCHLLQHESR